MTSPSIFPTHWKPAVLRTIFFLLTALLTFAYWEHFDNPFVFDDMHAIVMNSSITSLDNIPEMFRDKSLASVLPANQTYRPVVTASLALDYFLGQGLHPETFHYSMFAVFILQHLVFFALLRKLFTDYGKRLGKLAPDPTLAALIATTVFAFHTGIAETVNYIVARSDLYSTFFVVLSLWFTCYIGGVTGALIGGLVAFVAFLTKEPTIVLPALAMLTILVFQSEYDFSAPFGAKSRRVLRETFFRCLPTFVGTSAGLLLYLAHNGSAPQPANHPIVYLFTQFWVVTRYLGAFVLPNHLSADHDLHAFINIFDLRVQIGFIVLLTVALLAKRALRSPVLAPAGYGIFWFFIALAVTSSIIPIDDVMNDHRMYFPFLGLSLTTGWGAALTWKRARDQRSLLSQALLCLFCAIYLGGHVLGIRDRCEVWSSDESVWLDVTQESPENPRGLMNYGVTQLEKGRYARAEEYFLRALKTWPNYSILYINLGVVKGVTNRPVEAERDFRHAIELQPQNPTPYYFYARWLRGEGRIPEAREQVAKALALSPRHSSALDLQAQLSKDIDPSVTALLERSLNAYRNGQFQESLTLATEILAKEPNNSRALNNVGAALIALKRPQEALVPLRRALEIDPKLDIARNNLKSIEAQSGPAVR